MNTLQYLIYGFSQSLMPENLLSALVGAIVGLVVGALPGLGAITGVALLLPLTFKSNPTTAIIMLAAIYYANMYGGSFSAILINIPGDSSAMMTVMDGYPMASRGKAGKATFTAAVSSFLGGTIGVIILTFIGPGAARVGVTFGPPEMTWLVILGLTSIGWVIGENPQKGLMATAIGGMLATIGMTPSTGRVRYTFGTVNLMSGINFVPLVIGVFGFSKVIDMVIKRSETGAFTDKKITIRESLLDRSEMKRILPVVGRSGIMGTFVGMLPGAGATMATFFAYITEKRIGKHRSELGTGAVEGIAAPESANNAASMGAFAPMLALGVPGSSTTAVLMGGLMMWGLTPGPLLFQQKPDFVWGLISSMYVGNIICFIVAIAAIPFLMKIVKVPTGILLPIISSICILGAYSVRNSFFDVGVMLVVAFLAYFMKLAGLPEAPMLLAYVLIPLLERYITAAIDMSTGNMLVFVSTPICKGLLALVIVCCIAPIIIKTVKRIRTENKGVKR